jgi:hypothetical protein
MPYLRTELEGVPDEVLGDPIVMMVTMDTLSSAESLRSLEGAGVLVGDKHEWLTPETAALSNGHVAGQPRVEGPFVEVDLLVTDPEAIRKIESGECPEISAAYHAESVFEPGEWNGDHYHARQTKLVFNHILACPAGMARGGPDMKILNQKKENRTMPDLIRFKLPRTGQFVNVDEEGARRLEEEQKEESKADEKVKNESEEKGKSLEKQMGDHEKLLKENEELKAKLDESAGELKVYKDKLDELLSDDTLEKKADEMNEEQGEADEVLENCSFKNEKGEEDEKKKEEIKNSIRKLHGAKLHSAVLTAAGVKIENMSPEVLRGAFKAHVQILRSSGKSKGSRTVAGTNMLNKNQIQNTNGGTGSQYTAMQRLGYDRVERQ